MKVIDPVCGMALEEKDVSGTSSYHGKTYSFCSDECKKNFDRDPTASLRMMKAREKFVAAQKAQTIERVIDEVTHEIRNPLTAIGGFVRRVHERLPDNDPNRKYLELAMDNIKRLEKMVQQLAEFRSQTSLYIEPHHMTEIMKEVLRSFGKELKQKNIEVKAELSADPLPVLIERDKMTMTLSNLVRNAVEAMQKAPKILTIKSRVAGKHVDVSISDTGRVSLRIRSDRYSIPFLPPSYMVPASDSRLRDELLKSIKVLFPSEVRPGRVQLSQYACHGMSGDGIHENYCCRS